MRERKERVSFVKAKGREKEEERKVDRRRGYECCSVNSSRDNAFFRGRTNEDCFCLSRSLFEIIGEGGRGK